MASRRAVITGGIAAFWTLAWARGSSPLTRECGVRTSVPAMPPNTDALRFTPKFISTKDGTRLRTAVFAAASPRKICVLLSGQGEFIEKYGEVIGELNGRDYTVATFDWRGQGGSARLLGDPLKAHVRDFADYDDDLACFLNQIVSPMTSEPPLVLAHSMGGHILLRTLHATPHRFRAAVLTAPMIALQTRGYPSWMVRAIPALYGALGRSDDFAWGMAEKDPLKIDFEHQICTSDRRRYERTHKMILHNPALRLAGPTWGWIAAANRSMSEITAPGFPEAISTPILFVGAGHDRVALAQAGHRFARRLPHCTYTFLGDAEHEILMERDSIRGRFWTAFDQYVVNKAA